MLAAPMKQWKAAHWTGAFLSTKPGQPTANLTLRGGGTIDGNGSAWWQVTHDDLHYRPGMAALANVAGLTIEDVLLLNSPNHNIFLSNCTGVRVRRLRVSAPHHSPNTDGINFAGGSDQSIEDSHISNGDDCVSIVTGSQTTAAPALAGGGQIPYGGNVLVRNVTCDGGHGVSIGSIKHGLVTNATIEDVRFVGSDNGARIKTYPSASKCALPSWRLLLPMPAADNQGLGSGISYRNITMQAVVNPILIDGEYCPVSQKPYPCPPGKVAVAITDILFEDISGTALTGRLGNLDCSAVPHSCENITLRDVHLKPSLGGGKGKFQCTNAAGAKWIDSSPGCG